MHSKARSRRRIALLWCGTALAVPAWWSALHGQAEDRPVVPDGFAVAAYAEGLGEPRGMAFGPDGALYVTLAGEGRVLRLADADGDGRADGAETVIADLDRPLAIAWQGDDLWVATMTRVIRARAPEPGSTRGYTVVADSLPPDGPPTRALVFEPAGRAFYLSIPASCELCNEEDPRRAAILRFGLDGDTAEVWAWGLQAAAGLAFHPGTSELWATDVGRDGLGQWLPPAELNVIRRGGGYGWPYCYGRRLANPEFADRKRCDVTEPPVMGFPAHSAPQGIAFYTGDGFPEQYRSDAFVALNGSPDGRSIPAGFKIVRLRVEAGRPVAVEDFATGWLADGGRVWGRPAVPLVGPDGALYVSDDAGGRVWRITYRREVEHSVDTGR